MDKPLTKTHFKTSEGRYLLWSERTTGLIPFQNGRATRLTVATLRGGAEQGQYMVFNVGEQLHICPYDGTDKVRAGGFVTQLASCSGQLCMACMPCSSCKYPSSASCMHIGSKLTWTLRVLASRLVTGSRLGGRGWGTPRCIEGAKGC